MPYTKTTWVSGGPPGIDADKLNNLETQYDAAKADIDAHTTLTTAAHGGIVPSSDVVTTPTANKILKLDDSARYPGDIVKTKNVSSTDLNNLKKTGFYDGDNMINAPGGAVGWFYIEVIEHTFNPVDWVTQTAYDFNGGKLWFRNLSNGVWGAWNSVWHTGNDGANSGLDADTVDGTHLSQIVGWTAPGATILASALTEGTGSVSQNTYVTRKRFIVPRPGYYRINGEIHTPDAAYAVGVRVLLRGYATSVFSTTSVSYVSF